MIFSILSMLYYCHSLFTSSVKYAKIHEFLKKRGNREKNSQKGNEVSFYYSRMSPIEHVCSKFRMQNANLLCSLSKLLQSLGRAITIFLYSYAVRQQEGSYINYVHK